MGHWTFTVSSFQVILSHYFLPRFCCLLYFGFYVTFTMLYVNVAIGAAVAWSCNPEVSSLSLRCVRTVVQKQIIQHNSLCTLCLYLRPRTSLFLCFPPSKHHHSLILSLITQSIYSPLSQFSLSLL